MITNNGYHHRNGRAYIAIPSDLDRITYIKDCYTNMWVSIMTEDGGFMNRVPISPEVLNFIEFPATASKLGTPVVYCIDSVTNNPIVTSRLQLQENIGDGKEYQFKFKRGYNDKLVEISGSPKDNTLNFIVNGGNNGGQLNLILHSKDLSSQLNARVAGVIDFEAQGEAQHKAVGKTTLKTFDAKYKQSSTFEQLPDSHRFISKMFNINDGKEPFMLGKKWQKVMEDFIDEVATSTVATAIGTQPLMNAAKIMIFKQRLKEALSEVGFIDK